ncbi:hypothetical protein GGI07_004252 [Coemansia sp. Benny D115]|nr:hypothetical protein GGI07_004252 [Coemansia sp. Benny D115]
MDMAVPPADMPLEWWSERQIFPEIELGRQFLDTIKVTTFASGAKAARVLAKVCPEEDSECSQQITRQSLSISGRITALSSIFSTERKGLPGEYAFLVDLAVDAMPMVTGTAKLCEVVTISVQLIGPEFGRLYTCLSIGDTMVVTDLKKGYVSTESAARIPIFYSTPTSRGYRVDDFDGFEEIQLHVSQQQQQQQPYASSFNHFSQESLVQQMASGCSAAIDVTSSAERSQGHSNGFASGDGHLLIRQSGLESYEGEVTRALDHALGIYVIDDSHILILACWPQFSPGFILRPGTRVLIDNMHVALLSNSSSYRWSWIEYAWPQRFGRSVSQEEQQQQQRVLVFGACARSLIRITAFSSLTVNSSDTIAVLLDPALHGGAHGGFACGGMARVIETMEAYWKFKKKFPHGPLAPKSSHEAPLDLMRMARTWTGSAAGCEPNVLTLAFLQHSKHCRSGRDGMLTRVVTLGNVLRRLSVYCSHKMQTDDAEADAVDASAFRVHMESISASDLLLKATPLIGRVLVSARGELFLWDDTGHIRVQPSCFPMDQHRGNAAGWWQPAFAGQQLVGHVCAWNQWRVVTETVRVALISSNTGNRRSPDFELVYAAVCNPAVIYADPSFGGVCGGSVPPGLTHGDPAGGSGARTEQQECLCYAVLVHWQSAAQPKLDMGGEQEASSSGHNPRICARGVAVRISHDEFHAKTLVCAPDSSQSQLNAPMHINGPDGRGSVAEHCIVQFSPGKVPVQLASGCTYVLCLHNVRSALYMGDGRSGTQKILAIRLGHTDHVHPVRISTDVSPVGVGAPSLARDLGIPHIRISVARDSEGMLQPPRVLSVRDVCDTSVLDGGGSGKLVAACGVVQQREVRRVVEFARPMVDGVKSTGLVAGLFENTVVLQDESDAGATVIVYLRLSSYAHPLGLLPGSCVVFHNVVVHASKATGGRYLVSTKATSLCSVLLDFPLGVSAIPEHIGHLGMPEVDEGRVCIGQIYAWHASSAKRHGDADAGVGIRRRFELSCQVNALEYLSLAMECRACQQIVRGTSCSCVNRRHVFVDRQQLRQADDEHSGSASNVTAWVEVQCRVSDGSGVARLVANGAECMASLLDLTPGEVLRLYGLAAESWNGRLQWKATAGSLSFLKQHPNYEASSDLDAVVGRIADRVFGRQGGGGSIGVQAAGYVAEAPLQELQQPLKIGGQSMPVCKYALPRINAQRISRLDTAEHCWALLSQL